jgi:D-alanyl-D-alanine endopeptidase (penicillin-binding protein 7)
MPYRFLLVTLALLVATPAWAGDPKVNSKAVMVMDTDGNDVWTRDADVERPIGSMTKIFVAMALRRKGLDLKTWTTIEKADVINSAGGSRTRLPQGESFKNIDLLRAMLMVSDNRAPTALARSVGMDKKALLAEMASVASDLGLTHTHFSDVTGIGGNTSTAREIAIALKATLDDDVLAKIMRTRKRHIESKSKKAKIDYRSTVIPLHEASYKVWGGKTGHTDEAGYCMIIKADISNKTYVMALLGGTAKSARLDDFLAIAKWITKKNKISRGSAAKRLGTHELSGSGT